MSAKVLPTLSHCAVGPDGKIDIDLIRRNQASCHSAASNIHGMPWSWLASKGWRVVPVRISLASEPEEEAPAPPAPKPRPAPAPAPRGPDRMSAAEYRSLVGADAVPMLRCGEKRR